MKLSFGRLSFSLSPASCRLLVRLAYLFPALGVLFLWVDFAIPNLYFFYGGEAYETVSLFSLVSNTWNECRSVVSGNTNASTAAFAFSLRGVIFSLLFWVIWIAVSVNALLAAGFTTAILGGKPTDPLTNRRKRWFRFFGHGRFAFWIGILLTLLPPLFPALLISLYRELLGMEMAVYSIGPSSILWALLWTSVSAGLLLAALPIERHEHLDPFRLYKKKSDSSDSER